MRSIVFAPDGFKGSISAADAAGELAAGWASVHPGDRIVLRPVADGGEGTLEAFAAGIPGSVRMPIEVTGPGGRPMAANWLLLPDGTGVVELAGTCGIELFGTALRPWDASTTALGQAIAAALAHGVSRLLVGIGSSASTDGGLGMLTALGADALDAAGRPVRPGARGLLEVAAVRLSGLRPLPPGGVLALSDVDNPLAGPRGAAVVFGPQKGLDPDDLPRVDHALERWGMLLPSDPAEPGAGAAGGTGFALRAWGATLVPGAAEVARVVGLADALSAASVVVTGEGSYDAQSAGGKAPAHVARLAADAGVPVALAAGRISPDADVSAFAASASLSALAGSPDAALSEPHRWLRAAGAALARAF